MCSLVIYNKTVIIKILFQPLEIEGKSDKRYPPAAVGSRMSTQSARLSIAARNFLGSAPRNVAIIRLTLATSRSALQD